MREPNRETYEAFLAALSAVRLRAAIRAEATPTVEWDAIGSIEGVPVVVELKPVPAVADVLALDRAESHGAYKVLVARRLSAAVRAALTERDIGYFDSRGRLRLWRRPVLVDTDVPAVTGLSAEPRAPRLDVPSLLDVGLAVLEGSVADGVRATAKLVGRAPGTVSKQLAALRAAHLVGEDAEPLVPDLFEAVVEVWRPVRVPLAALPREGAGPVSERLQLGWDDPMRPGWVLADLFAAAAWGAPVVLAGSPRDFYVPDARTLRQARTLLGDAEFGRHACTVAVAPAPFVCRRRYDRTETFDGPFYAPSPVVAALDLASDPGRGRETLDLWSRNLPPEVRRVW